MALKPVPGFRALRNKTRQYENTKTGEIISKRQYQKLQNAGLSNERAAKQRLEQREFNIPAKGEKHRHQALLKDYIREEKARAIKAGKKRFVLNDKELNKFDKIIVELKQLGRKRGIDRSSKGRLAQLLVLLGRRSPEWDMPVGESPK